MIYSFELTNLESVQIYRFEKDITQEEQIPIIGQLQMCVLHYISELELLGSVSEMFTTVGSGGDVFTMRIVGGENERFFAKVKATKCREGDESDGNRSNNP